MSSNVSNSRQFALLDGERKKHTQPKPIRLSSTPPLLLDGPKRTFSLDGHANGETERKTNCQSLKFRARRLQIDNK